MMRKDFLIEMEYPGLTARLKRLSDSFVYQTKEFYKSRNIEIEPNWHMIFLLLIKHGQLTVMQISEALDLSHPAIVKLINKMKNKGYIISNKDKEDNRKYQLELSDKAKAELPLLQQYWEAGNQAIEEMMNHNKELLEQLEIVEKNMDELDFKSRMHENLKRIKNQY